LLITTKTLTDTTQAVQKMQRAYGLGELGLKFEAGQNRLERLFQEGSARLRMPKNTPFQPVEAVMINTSGGLTDGDALGWKFDIGNGASATITSQACERIYKATQPNPARVNANIHIGIDGYLAWLPQETILFDQSYFERKINIHLDKGAELLMVEPVVFGRAAMGEQVKTAHFKDQWRVYCDKKLAHAEYQSISGNISDTLQKTAITSGHIAMCSMLYIGKSAEQKLELVRRVLGDHCGASLWRLEDGTTQKLVIRMMAATSYDLRKTMIPVLEQLYDKGPLPRVWST
jgi:urease accessory protein